MHSSPNGSTLIKNVTVVLIAMKHYYIYAAIVQENKTWIKLGYNV